jgi:hypothetical protein
MRISQQFCDAQQWASTHFGTVQLGDVRRQRRVCTLVAGWARQPGASIPQLGAGSAYASKAAYQLLGGVAVTPDVLQEPHRQLVHQQLQQAGTYLLVEDTTQVRWAPATARRAGLGPVGAGASGEQGVLLHSLVAARWPASAPPAGAVRPPLPLLGLLDQQFYVRQARPAAEKAHRHGGSRPRKRRARESALWARSLRAVGSPPATARWVVVADRGADSYEHLRQCRQQGLGFVVRAAQDRGLVTPPAVAPTLFAVARAQPSAGQLELALRARPGQAARQVRLQVSYSPLLALRAPQRPGASTGKGEPVAASVVRVWEPGGKLEWLLLCDDVISSFPQARERARQYASRWLIEDFHKALKTGLGAERLQLHTAPRLFAAVALLSVVALALVDLREHSRQQPDAPAEAAGLSANYLRVLRSQRTRSIRTVRDVFYALAGLGGHLGRTGDGPPGWQTLWLGLVSLRYLVEGVRLAALLPPQEH